MSTKNYDMWDDLTCTITSQSNRVSEYLGEGYKVSLVNPWKTENYLLVANNGELLYNYLEDEVD